VTDATAGSEGGADVPSEQGSPTDGDLERVKAERDALQEELTRTKRPKRRPILRTIVALLVAISCILVVLSTTVVWAHRTVLNTDTFVGTIGPVFSVPGVSEAVATRVTNELFTELDIQGRLKDNLPPKVSFAAAPITSATKGFVTDQFTKVFSSEKFQTFWTNTLRRTHEQVVAVLHGQNTKSLSTQNGYIVLNTVPVINEALARVSGLASSLTGKHFTAPTISSAELPQKSIDKLSKALGVQLPSNFGQIQLVKAAGLNTVQHGVRAFDRLTILLPILTLVVIALMLWLSVARRRTLIQFLVGSLLILIVERRIVLHAQSTLASKAHNPQVAQDVLGQLLHGFFVLSAWVLGIGLVILVIALVTGPYRWAVALRSFVTRCARWVAQQFSAERRERTLAWMSAHATILQFAGAVVAAVLFLIVSVSWISFLIVGVLLALFEFWMQRLKPPDDGTSEPPGPEPQADVPSAVGGR
jgi:hypothetical protein